MSVNGTRNRLSQYLNHLYSFHLNNLRAKRAEIEIGPDGTLCGTPLREGRGIN